MATKTIDDVKKEFLFSGITIAQWAKKHGYSYHQVQNVLSGRSQNSRGKSHEIAILLGIKEGVIMKNY